MRNSEAEQGIKTEGWDDVASRMIVDGLSYGIDTSSLSLNLGIKIVEASCTRMTANVDEADCSRLVMLLVQKGTHVMVGPHKSKRPQPTHDTEHQMIFSPPGARQYGFFDGPAERLRWMVVQFDRPLLAERFGEYFEAPEFRPRYMFFNQTLYEIARHIERECMYGNALTALHDDTLAVSVLRTLGRIEPEATPTDRLYGLNPRQRRRLADYMSARLADNIRLKELADLVHLSPSHFCRAFKASVGLSPHAWQLRERIRAAKAALSVKTASLADVANLTGFHDQAHFTRAFKRMTGVNPGAWRQLRYH